MRLDWWWWCWWWWRQRRRSVWTSCAWFAAAENEGFIYIMNPRASFWRAVDGGENNKCLPQINNGESGGLQNVPVHKWLCQCSRFFFSIPLFLSFPLSDSLFDKLFDQKFRRRRSQQRLSFLTAETKPHRSRRRHPRRLQTAYLPALLPESDSSSNEIPTQLNIWALCRWCPHK